MTNRTTQAIETQSRTLALFQNGQHISIDDDHMRLLGGDLMVRRLIGTGDLCHGYDIRQGQQSLLRSPDGFRIPNAGCVPILRRRAADRDIDLRIQASPAIVRLPAPSNMDRLGYPSLAQFARQHERGLIRVSQGFDPAIVVSELAMAYPNQRIVVLGTNVSPLKKIASQLAATGQDIQTVCSRRPLTTDVEEMPRISCSTFLEAGDLDFATSDIVVMLDATNCTHNRAQLALEQVDSRFRLFGIVHEGRKIAPFESGTMMGVFGPELIYLGPYRRVRRLAHVARVTHNQPRIEQELEGSDFGYRCCWHSERRNRAIANIAKAIAADTALAGQDFGDVSAWRQEREYGPQAVTILVDRLDHAVSLGKKLPEWPIVAGKEVNLRGYPGSVRNRLRRDRHAWIDGRRQIVLTDATSSFRGDVSDVLIWAGAGPCIGSLPDAWLWEPSDSNRPLLIVDFKDQFNKQMRTWSRSRRKSYATRDIFEVGVDPAQGRTNRFLHEQQRGKR